MKKKGMNTLELKELKAALLKAERLDLLVLLMSAKNVEEAVEAIKQRLKA